MKSDIHTKSRMRQEEMAKLRTQLSSSEKQQCETEEALRTDRTKILKLQEALERNLADLKEKEKVIISNQSELII